MVDFTSRDTSVRLEGQAAIVPTIIKAAASRDHEFHRIRSNHVFEVEFDPGSTYETSEQCSGIGIRQPWS